jgi:prophage antirepressor-like protein
MNSDVVVFSFGSTNVRTLTKDGEVFFRASDVAQVLGVRTNGLLQRVPKDEISLTDLVDSLGKTQEVAMLSEAGLYRAVLRSDKREAEPFIRWVTRDVLPSIRKQGYYLSETLKEQLAEKDMELARKEAVILQLQGKKKRDRRWSVPCYESQLPGFPIEPRMVLKPQAEIKQPELNIAKYNHLKKTIEGIERQMLALKREIGMA